MDTIKIRPAGAHDLGQLLEFEQELINAERPMDPTISKDPVRYYDLAAMTDDPEVALLVAEKDGRLIASGYAMARRARPYLDHEYYAYLGFMYTIPEFRGMGVNRKIIRALHEWAVRSGLRELRLTVYDTNVPAIKAYEKAGFGKHIVEMRLTGNDN